MVFLKNNGSDFPSVPDHSISFIFTFGAFVHLEIDIIDAYLKSMKRILQADCNVVIQYSDKTKVLARKTISFSENTPEIMRTLVLDHGYKILEEDVTSIAHSSVMRFAEN